VNVDHIKVHDEEG